MSPEMVRLFRSAALVNQIYDDKLFSFRPDETLPKSNSRSLGACTGTVFASIVFWKWARRINLYSLFLAETNKFSVRIKIL